MPRSRRRAPESATAVNRGRVDRNIRSGLLVVPEHRELAAEGFPNGRVVRITGSGHDILRGSPCAQRVTLDFLDDPTGYDAACAATVPMPAFE